MCTISPNSTFNNKLTWPNILVDRNWWAYRNYSKTSRINWMDVVAVEESSLDFWNCWTGLFCLKIFVKKWIILNWLLLSLRRGGRGRGWGKPGHWLLLLQYLFLFWLSSTYCFGCVSITVSRLPKILSIYPKLSTVKKNWVGCVIRWAVSASLKLSNYRNKSSE